MVLYAKLNSNNIIQEISKQHFDRLKASGYKVRHFYGVHDVWDVIDMNQQMNSRKGAKL